MAPQQLRINVVFDRYLYTMIKEISQGENVFMSAKEEELMSHEEVRLMAKGRSMMILNI